MIRLAGLLLLMTVSLRPLWAQDTPMPADPPQPASQVQPAPVSIPVQSPAVPTPAVPGQNDPAFQEALEAWLADDEETALPALAELARGGNTAAQILLALIDKSPELQGPWLARLPRRERVPMMRDSGGISGHSWIHAAAGSSPLAEHWQATWAVDTPHSVIGGFSALGEGRAARAAAITIAARERRGFAELADDPHYPHALRYFIWREWAGKPEHLARLTEEIMSLPEGDPQRDLMGEPSDPAALADWLMTAAETRPIAIFCTARCGATAPACAQAAARALADPLLVMSQGSPAEALVDTERFAESPRGQAALLRRVLLGSSARMRPAMLARLSDIDACFAEQVQSEAQRY
ncbi:hypothetical protein [Halodurantibacterium flavum]|uniref:HEAT repeat domain-containing protein n=1 Tax=Halodurantibacterium flavum TaxID=1382802 RepID=A0ABW4S4R1_9RHOB